jgi:hypothetical protein
MSFKKILSMLLLTLALTVTALLAVSCGSDGGDGGGEPCTKHVDTNGDSKCDECEEDYTCPGHRDANSDGKCDECKAAYTCPVHLDINEDGKCDNCLAPYTLPTVTYTAVILDEGGNAVSGVTVTVRDLEGEEIDSFVTNSEGEGSLELSVGEYRVYFEGLDDMCTIAEDGHLIEISQTASFEYTVIDFTPDGSEDKPFYINEEEMTFAFEAGETLYFQMRGETRTLSIEGVDFKVGYDGEDYLPESGALSLLLEGPESIYQVTPFTVTNTSDTAVELEFVFTSLPGTQGNPYVAELGTPKTATVEKEGTVFYTVEITEAGYIVVTTEDDDAVITIQNRTNSTVTSYNPGAVTVYLAVAVGDEVLINVSSSADEVAEISFVATFSETEPE